MTDPYDRDDLLPFGAHKKCPKCECPMRDDPGALFSVHWQELGFPAFKIEYVFSMQGIPETKILQVDEYLQITCPVCAYHWFEITADVTKEREEK